MGNESVVAQSAELFSFNGHYSVPLDNDSGKLLDDASCFMTSGLEILRNEIMEFEDTGGNESHPGTALRLWGAYHLLQLTLGVVRASRRTRA